MDSCLLEERPKRLILPDEGDVEPEVTLVPGPGPLPPPNELSPVTPGATKVSVHNISAHSQRTKSLKPKDNLNII